MPLPKRHRRRSAEHFGDAGAGSLGGTLGQSIDREEAMIDDLMAGHRLGRLTELPDDVLLKSELVDALFDRLTAARATA